MRVERVLVGLLLTTAVAMAGCQGRLAYSLPPAARLMEPGPGVSGPGPGVIPTPDPAMAGMGGMPGMAGMGGGVYPVSYNDGMGGGGGGGQMCPGCSGRGCDACHGTGLLGAPKIGDAADWGKRAKEQGGVDGLLAKAITGINAMPPKGTCSDCSDDELKGAIEKMSGLK